MTLIKGYGRRQGVVFRRGDERFAGRDLDEVTAVVRGGQRESAPLMVNRNQGSGTRILIDELLDGARPRGYAVQATTHNAVAAAVAQGRADWGVAIESVARANGLGFLFYKDEQYDFVVPNGRRSRPAVVAFVALLSDESTKKNLEQMGFRVGFV
jgi:putative molybdopterin biosynthesis protein